jgi:hydroxypyruvate reductase
VITDPPAFLLDLFRHAVAATDPRRVAHGHWPRRPAGRLIVLGAGKAAAAMAQAAEAHYGEGLTGLVVTRDGYDLPTTMIEVTTAGHPLPDGRSLDAGRRMLALAATAGLEDTVLCLISGGASALMSVPTSGLEFEDKQAINAALLNCGASIAEINCVRKHLSAVKGGRLAQACGGARVVSLIISDVVGDDPSIIASGPTVADPTTCADALAVLMRYRIGVPAHVVDALQDGHWESPKAMPGPVENIIVGRPADAFRAAQAFAARHGLACLDLGDHFDGLAADVAAAHTVEIRAVKSPCLILSGGEAVVRVAGRGRGGPNTEFALALALDLKGASNVYALACDSDGTDGKGGHAGALIRPETLTLAAARGLDPARARADNDTAAFFEALGDLVVTGPTYTNVNDFRAVLIT